MRIAKYNSDVKIMKWNSCMYNVFLVSEYFFHHRDGILKTKGMLLCARIPGRERWRKGGVRLGKKRKERERREEEEEEEVGMVP